MSPSTIRREAFLAEMNPLRNVRFVASIFNVFNALRHTRLAVIAILHVGIGHVGGRHVCELDSIREASDEPDGPRGTCSSHSFARFSLCSHPAAAEAREDPSD
jgi:hypothetical protein